MYCQLEALRHCLPSSVRGILDELLETLDETYERALKEINKANRDHARRLLHCLTAAVRPLRVEELAEVLAVDFHAAFQGGIPKSNPDWHLADQHEAVLSTCSSLIAIVGDGSSQVLQFSHFSVKEFLTSDRLSRSSGNISQYHILMESAHTILAQACLSLLLRLDGRVNRSNAGDIPLVEYATEHWVRHAQFEKVSSCIGDAMKYLFDRDKPCWTSWLRVHNVDKPWFLFTPDEMHGGSPLYYAALCGFYNVAELLVGTQPEHINARGGLLVVPLVAALYRKHFEVAELLHRHGADVNVLGRSKATLLKSACDGGLVDMVRWLLSHGADVNAQDIKFWSPLHRAANNGDLEITRMLLQHNPDINPQTQLGHCPLHSLDIMQLLLDHGVDPNARDYGGSTPLQISSWWGKQGYLTSEETVEGTRLLLKYGADIHAEDNEGRTPLQLALAHGRDEMAKVLCEHGAKR